VFVRNYSRGWLLAFQFQDEVPAMELDWRQMFVTVVDVDGGDEQLDGRAVSRVQMSLTSPLRSTDVVIVPRSRVATFAHVHTHRTAGRRQLDHRRRRRCPDERLRRRVVRGSSRRRRSIPACHRGVRRQTGSEAVQRHAQPLAGLGAEASGTRGRERCRGRPLRRRRLIVVVDDVGRGRGVIAVWIDVMGVGQHEAERVDGVA